MPDPAESAPIASEGLPNPAPRRLSGTARKAPSCLVIPGRHAPPRPGPKCKRPWFFRVPTSRGLSFVEQIWSCRAFDRHAPSLFSGAPPQDPNVAPTTFPSAEPPAKLPPPGPRSRTLLALGAVIVAAGVALVGTTLDEPGGVVLLVGWVTLALAIHRFGRGDV